MADVGLFFGSDEGNTEKIAYRIQKRFGVDVVDVHDVADITQAEFAAYDKIILGIPTWDFGQIQTDWEEFWDDITAIDFTGKQIALFGLGDQFGYAEYFLDAMGMLHDVVVRSADEVVGHWSTDGYEFEASKAEIPDTGLFVGLALDEDHQENLTEERLNRWCEQIRDEFGLSSPIEVFSD